MSQANQTNVKSEKQNGLRGVMLGTTQSFMEHAAQLSGLKSKPVIRNVNSEFEDKLTLGQRISDKIAATMGSWRFIIIQSCILAVWITLNIVGLVEHWDPYPFILLNLALSFQAAYAAPIIMMSQNRQADKDRLAAQNDFEVNKLGEIETQAVLLHLEQQDRLIIKLLERVDQLAEQSKLPWQGETFSAGRNTKSTVYNQKLDELHRQQIEADMTRVVNSSLQESQLEAPLVRELLCQCYAIVNIESFQHDNLIEPNYKIDPHHLEVLKILFKESFISVGADYEHPDVEDLTQVRDWLSERMKYRGMDPELIDKFNELSQQLINKVLVKPSNKISD